MKTLKKQIRFIALIFSITMLFQSCKVYYKDSVTLEQAVNEHKRTKVETVTKQTYKFQAISFENDQYYGIKRVKGTNVKTLIDKSNISKVVLENKTMSTILSIGFPVVIIGAGFAIIESSVGFAMGGFGSYGY